LSLGLIRLVQVRTRAEAPSSAIPLGSETRALATPLLATSNPGEAQLASAQLATVENRQGLLRLVFVAKIHKSETPRLPCLAIDGDTHGDHHSG
jgi:hypothetical protein